MRFLAGTIALLAAVAVGGCGGSEEPHVVVRVAVFPFPEGPGPIVAARGPGESVPVNYIQLSRIRNALPDRFPENPAQPCNVGAKVEIGLDDGSTLEYGPCKRPASIERLRLALVAAWRSTRWLAPGPGERAPCGGAVSS